MRLSEDCFAVTGLSYIPPWSVNAGFVTGQRMTLVADTGANALAAATIHGYASVVRPANKFLVIDTEQHFDHIGGNGYFRERDIDVYGHPLICRTDEEFRAEMAEFNSLIPNPVRREREEANVFYRQTCLANPNRLVKEDMRFDLGDCDVEILLTPGHTPSNLSVWVPRDRVLFCGDCLANGYLPNLDCGSAPDWRLWLESLDRITRLAPDVVVCGHGPVAIGDDVQRLIDTVRRTLEQSLADGFSPTSIQFSRSKSSNLNTRHTG